MRYTSRSVNLLGAAVLGIHDRLIEAVVSEAGRAGATAAALATLSQYEGLTIEALRSCLGISQPATVRLVDALVAGKLARRGPGPDRRSVSITLTAAGHEEASKILAARAAVLAPLLDDTDERDQAALDRVLERLLTRLTTDARRGDELCRLCDVKTCPQERCPVECTARAHKQTNVGEDR